MSGFKLAEDIAERLQEQGFSHARAVDKATDLLGEMAKLAKSTGMDDDQRQALVDITRRAFEYGLPYPESQIPED